MGVVFYLGKADCQVSLEPGSARLGETGIAISSAAIRYRLLLLWLAFGHFTRIYAIALQLLPVFADPLFHDERTNLTDRVSLYPHKFPQDKVRIVVKPDWLTN